MFEFLKKYRLVITDEMAEDLQKLQSYYRDYYMKLGERQEREFPRTEGS